MRDKFQLSEKKLLFKEGDPVTKLYLVKSGEVLCLKQSKDRLIPVFRARDNDIVGENAMIAGSVYSYSAITNSMVELVEIPTTNFSQILKESPRWLMDLTATMIERFQHTANLIAENRVIHAKIIDEDNFTSAQEVEFKKILS